MDNDSENLDGSGSIESHVYTWAMRALFSSIPQPSYVNSHAHLLFPRALGKCPECGGVLEFRLFDVKKGSAKISVGFRCTDRDLRRHFYINDGYTPFGEMIQSFYFLKWHGLPFDRSLNEDEQKYVAWVMEDYEARSGEGSLEEEPDSVSGDSKTAEDDSAENLP